MQPRGARDQLLGVSKAGRIYATTTPGDSFLRTGLSVDEVLIADRWAAARYGVGRYRLTATQMEPDA